MINFKNILFLFNTLSVLLLYISAIETYINISKSYNGTNFVVGTYILFNGLVLSYIQLNNKKMNRLININLPNKLHYFIFILEFICSIFMLTLSTFVMILGCILLFISIFNLSYAFFIDEVPVTNENVENNFETPLEMNVDDDDDSDNLESTNKF